MGPLFTDKHIDNLRDEKIRNIKNEIDSLKKEDILSFNSDEYITYLKKKYCINIPKLLYNNQYQLEPEEVPLINKYHNGIQDEKGIRFVIIIPYEGDKEIFFCHFSSFKNVWPRGDVSENVIEFSFVYDGPDNQRLELELKNNLNLIEWYLKAGSRDIERLNNEILRAAEVLFQNRKQKLIETYKIAESIKVPIKRLKEDQLLFMPTEIKRKINFQPPNASTKDYRPEPEFDIKEYDHTLEIIENMVHVMERTPGTFYQMEEEDLRNILLVILNGHYDGIATGETFNNQGKTDILIRYESKNIFIAECKFWKGPKSLIDALDQLLSYTSWRDTKAALIIFNKQKNLTNVLESIKNEIPKYKAYKGTLNIGETIFKYKFSNLDDQDKNIFLSVLVFNIIEPRKDNK